MSDCPPRTLAIINEKGLHARASAKLVEVVEA
ncbi:MAG: phosphocarrier protein, partial [Halocynthiibacter sp.]